VLLWMTWLSLLGASISLWLALGMLTALLLKGNHYVLALVSFVGAVTLCKNIMEIMKDRPTS
jgi:hypothetical protein